MDKKERIEKANAEYLEKEAALENKLEVSGGIPELGKQPDHVNIRDEKENTLLGAEGLSIQEVKDGNDPVGLRVHNRLTEYLKSLQKELDGVHDTYAPQVRSNIGFYIDRQEAAEISLRNRG